MISWLRRYRNGIFAGTIAIFMISIFVGYGGHLFTRSDFADSIAVVGSTKLPYMRYQVRVNQTLEAMREQKQEVTDELAREARRNVLRDMIVDEMLYQQAQKMGIQVTDMELRFNIVNTPRFQSNGQFDQGLYFRTIRSVLNMSPEDYEEQTRKSMMSRKVQEVIFASAKLLPDELKTEYMKSNKGSDKDFEKNKEAFARTLQQQRALDLINFYLRQLSSQMEIRDFLAQREPGA